MKKDLFEKDRGKITSLYTLNDNLANDAQYNSYQEVRESNIVSSKIV